MLLLLVGKTAAQLLGETMVFRPGAALPTSPFTPLALPAKWTPSPAGVDPNAPTTQVPALPAPLCGGPPTMNLLLIGSDTRSTGYTWGLADVIRLVRVDFVTPGLTTLDFPRDLWVEIPEISDNLGGQDHEKLNQAYLYGNPGDGFGYWDDPSAGPGLLARTLDLNFGAKADHYLAVNMQTFVRMVDALGGLDVTLVHSVGGSDNLNLQAGEHHLNGAEALALARDRSRGVFSRDSNQDLVICALQRQLSSPGVLPRLPALIQAFSNSIQTDLDAKSIGQLACLAGHLPQENIAFFNIPESEFTPDRIYDPVFEGSVFVWRVDELIFRNYVAQFQSGMWPEPADDGQSTGSPANCQ